MQKADQNEETSLEPLAATIVIRKRYTSKSLCFLTWLLVGTEADRCKYQLNQNIVISRETSCTQIEIFRPISSCEIWVIRINNETCNYMPDMDNETDSYCEYSFTCNAYPPVRYQCYNTQSRIDNCSHVIIFSSDRLILNISAFIEQYQDEITICASVAGTNDGTCSLETVISNYLIFVLLQ